MSLGGGDLQRRVRRVLTDVLGGDLVDRRRHVRGQGLLRMHAGQPGGRHERMHRAALAGLVADIADHGQLVSDRA